MSMDQEEKLAVLAKVQGVVAEDVNQAREVAEHWTKDLEFRTRTAAVLLRDVDARTKTVQDLEQIAEDLRAGKL